MSTFRSVIDREIGCERPFYYDNVLSRLAVVYFDPKHSNDFFHFPIHVSEFAESPQYTHYLATGDRLGIVKIYDTTRVSETYIRTEYQCHNRFILDMAWMPNRALFATASGDCTARLWDIGNGNVLRVRDFRSHTKAIRIVVFSPENGSVFVTGGCDGCIILWDIRCNSNVLAIAKPKDTINIYRHSMAQRTRSSYIENNKKNGKRLNGITGLVFQDDNTLISCGSGDGNIRVWDLRKNYSSSEIDPVPKYSFGHCKKTKCGYSNLILDKSKHKLYANCLNNDEIHCYNVGTYNEKPEQTYSGITMCNSCKPSLCPDGKYLLSGSIGENAYIWNVKRSIPIVKLGGHEEKVACARWSQMDNLLIATCSKDIPLRLWTIPKFES